MKYTFLVAILMFLFSCGHEHKMGPDYDQLKPLLKLDSKQEKQFDQITDKYNGLRKAAFAEARSGGKINREALLKQMKQLFKKQGEELKPVLSNEQFSTYGEWLQKNIPGRVGWLKELVAKIKTDLALDSTKAQMVDAVNKAFIEAYINAHDNYHGDNEAAKAYWEEFDNNRKNALKEVLSEEEYTKFLDVVKDVVFRGEHGK